MVCISDGALVPVELATCTSWTAPSVLKGICKFLSNICSHPNSFKEGLAFFSKTMLNHILHLLWQHSFVEEDSWDWSWKANCDKENTGVVSSWNPTPDKNGTTFLSQRSSSWSQFPHVDRLLIKEEGMLHSGKHRPVPTFESCCCHHIQERFSMNSKTSRSQHLKTLIHEILIEI